MLPAPGHPPEQDAVTARRVDAGQRLQEQPLGGAQGRVEVLLSVAFAAAAIALALADHGETAVAAVLCGVFALAVCQRVGFDVGTGWTTPSQVVVVALLILLPPGQLPAMVASATLLAAIPDLVAGRRHRARLPVLLNDAWFAVGPAVVLVAAGVDHPGLGDWPVLVLALGAQLIADAGTSWLRARGAGGDIRQHLAELREVWLVDLLLAPVGLVLGLAALRDGPGVVLLVLPLAVLLRRFAQDRRARLEGALELSDTYRRIALLLGDVIGDDDEYTGDHTQGVVELSVEVAGRLGLSPQDRQVVELGALLHDVGKIAVDNAIINKPGPLDEREWAVMRTHTIIGQDMLDRVGGSLHRVGVVVRASHERWDGSGYPDGLVGESIPLAARIVACADAFSAMTTDRSYRRARPVAAALDELRACAGTHFDPAVVAAVVDVLQNRGGAPAGETPPPFSAAA